MHMLPMLLFSLLYFVLYHPQALVKRSPSSGMSSTLKESSAFQSDLRMPDSAIRQQNASPSDKGKVTICDGKPGDEDRPKKSSVCKSIEGCQEELVTQVVRENVFISLNVSVSLTVIQIRGLHIIAFLKAAHFVAQEVGSFSTTDGIIHCSSHTRDAHVSHGSHPDQLPAGVSSGKQQPGSAGTQRTAHSGQSCGDD